MTEQAESSGVTFWGDVDDAEDLQRYRTLVNSIGDGVLQLDAESRFVAVNDSILELSGYAREELFGERVSLLFDDEDGSAIEREIDRLRSNLTEQSELLNLAVQTAEDERVHCEVRVSLLEGDDIMRGTVGTVRDITERKRREQRTKFLENLGREIQPLSDSDEIMAAAARLLGEYLDVDRCAYADVEADEDHFVITGDYSPGDTESIVGRWAFSNFGDDCVRLMRENEPYVVDDADADERITAADREAYDQTQIQSVICVPLHKGEQFTSAMAVHQQTPREWQPHEIGLVTTVVQRCWESLQRARAMHDLQESEERYRNLFESIDEGFCILEKTETGPDEPSDYRYLEANPAFETHTGLHGVVGKTIRGVLPDEAPKWCNIYDTVLETGEPTRFEQTLETEGWVLELYAFPLENEEVQVGVIFQDITEKKEQERQLRDAKSRLEAATEAGAVGTWEWHIPDDTMVVGPSFAKKFGIDPDAAADGVPLERFVSAIHEGDRDRVEREIEEAIQSGDEYEAEYRVWNADDELRWVVARGHVEYDEDGNPVMFPGALTEITQRKENQRKIERSERRYRTLAENFPNGAVSVYDHDLRYTLAQGAVLGDTLPSRDQIEGKTVPDVYPPHIVEDLEPQLRAAIEDGETSSAMFEFGGRNWQVWATPLRDAGGEIFAGLSFAQDITEQVEREAELERVLALFEKTEDIADVGGWEIDTETQDVFWTEHIFDLLEIPGDEEPPLDEALDMYHEEDKPIVVDAVENALASGDSFDVEVRLRTAASDEVRWLRLQGVPETVDGDVVSFRGAAQDVTERKQREQQLEMLVNDLKTSNERLEQFAYAASHDLQEPLRMVSSYLQMIEQRYGDKLDEDGEEFIDFAVDGADRMRNMIEGLLKYSRVETRGRSFEPVDLNTVLEDVREDLQVRIEEGSAKITTESLPRVEGDEGQLRQVFQNLLDNAIEYSGDEPPRIQASAERAWDEWVISVRDEGIGIDIEDTDRVFEVFESLHSSDGYSGTGIGLALCERIVERHGGDIWVDSEPGEGATFSFTLPAEGTHRD